MNSREENDSSNEMTFGSTDGTESYTDIILIANQCLPAEDEKYQQETDTSDVIFEREVKGMAVFNLDKVKKEETDSNWDKTEKENVTENQQQADILGEFQNEEQMSTSEEENFPIGQIGCTDCQFLQITEGDLSMASENIEDYFEQVDECTDTLDNTLGFNSHKETETTINKREEGFGTIESADIIELSQNIENTLRCIVETKRKNLYEIEKNLELIQDEYATMAETVLNKVNMLEAAISNSCQLYNAETSKLRQRVQQLEIENEIMHERLKISDMLSHIRDSTRNISSELKICSKDKNSVPKMILKTFPEGVQHFMNNTGNTGSDEVGGQATALILRRRRKINKKTDDDKNTKPDDDKGIKPGGDKARESRTNKKNEQDEQTIIDENQSENKPTAFNRINAQIKKLKKSKQNQKQPETTGKDQGKEIEQKNNQVDIENKEKKRVSKQTNDNETKASGAQKANRGGGKRKTNKIDDPATDEQDTTEATQRDTTDKDKQ